MTDGNSKATSYSYSDSGTTTGSNTYAFLTTVTYPAVSGGTAMTESYTWDYYLGKPLSHTDANSATTSFSYENSATLLDRLSEITAPGDGATTNYVYCDSGTAGTDCPSDSSLAAQRPSVLTKHDRDTPKDGILQTRTLYDSLGRVSGTLQSAPGGPIYVSKSYDALGQVVSATNPVYGTTAGSATTYSYDTLGRATAVTTADSATTSTSYNGLTTTVTDPAAAARTMVNDGLGRMTSVLDGSGVTTYYQYDVLDNLLGVCQGAAFGTNGNCPSTAQGRTFTYDGLRRLQTASNPETGNAAKGDTSYTYDGNGNLLTRTMAAASTTGSSSTVTISYDALNRPYLKGYSGLRKAPNVTLCYDGNIYGGSDGVCTTGTATNANMRVTEVRNSESSTAYTAYDARGRVTGYQQTPVGGPPYAFTGFTYNLAGGLTSITYPYSGRTVAQTFDSAGRVSAITGYASSITYEAHGGLTTMTLMTLGNSLLENWSYNSARMQPEVIQLGTASSSASVVKLETAYCDSGFQVPCGTNNGNVKMDRITADSGVWARRYKYDLANRLTQAGEYADPTGGLPPAPTSAVCQDSTSVWCEAYGYNDNYGNRLITARTGLSAPLNEPQAFDPATNRVTGTYWQYDEAGNVTQDGAQMGASYDGENRLVNAAGTSYGYDGDGKRVRRTSGGQVTTFVHGPDGQLAAEYGGPTPLVTGRLYVTVDQLGLTRVVTNSSGTPVERMDYLPSGEQILVSQGSLRSTVGDGYGATSDVKARFTGKERDAETGLDYFGARYLSSAQGRWMSPDWSAAPQAVPYADLSDPQTLNLYGYVRNNPLGRADADGHCFWDACIGEGYVAYVVIGGTVATAAYLMTPQGKETLRAAIVGTGALITKAVGAIANTVNESTEETVPPPNTSPRPSTEQIRKDWEKLHGKPWPVDPATGKPKEADHDVARADGGVDAPTNITPRPRVDHIQRHKDNGDFSRWARRRGKKPETPPQPPPPPPPPPKPPESQ